MAFIPHFVQPSPFSGWAEVFDPFIEAEERGLELEERRRPELPPEKVKPALEALQEFKVPAEADREEVLAVVSKALETQKTAVQTKPVKAAVDALQLIEDELVMMMLLGIDIPAHDRELTLAEFMLLLM